MRGKSFHNMIANRARSVAQGFFSSVRTEYRYRRNGAVTDFDIFACERAFVLAIEVETTYRRGIENAKKAASVDVPLWIIVPTRKLKAEFSRRLCLLELRPTGEPIKILLPDELEQELMNYLSLFIVANKQRINNKQIKKKQSVFC